MHRRGWNVPPRRALDNVVSKLARKVGHVSASVLIDEHLTKMVPGLGVTFETVFISVLCPRDLGIKRSTATYDS